MNDGIQYLIDAQKLEGMIDRVGLKALLEAIAIVCDEKATHVSENWQSSTLATNWARAGEEVFKASQSNAVASLP